MSSTNLLHLSSLQIFLWIFFQAAIDLDQQEIEIQLNDGTSDSIALARDIYQQGAHSKSYAKVKLASPLQKLLEKGTGIKGAKEDGTQVFGKAIADFPKDSTEIRIQYATSDDQDNYVNCQVGALSQTVKANTKGCKIFSNVSFHQYSYPFL